MIRALWGSGNLVRLSLFAAACAFLALALASKHGFQHFGMNIPKAASFAEDPIWGISMGIAMYLWFAAVNPGNSKGAQDLRSKTPSARALLLTGVFSVLAAAAICLILAIQEGLIDSQWLSRQDGMNPYFLGTLFGLGLLVPTHANGVMVPRGDERFRANQHRAAVAALRGLSGAVIILIFAEYGHWWSVPLSVGGTAALTLAVAIYSTVLWWFERADA